MYKRQYLNNRLLTKRTHKSLQGKTPYEIITGSKSDLSHIRIFGTKVKVAKTENYKRTKFDSKTWNGFHVGYAEAEAYRIFVPEIGRVIVPRDVTFFEQLHDEIYDQKDIEHSNFESESLHTDRDDEGAGKSTALIDEIAKKISIVCNYEIHW